MALPSSIIQRGDRASQPAATTVAAGTLYYVTDETVTERSTGAAWEDVTDGGAATAITALTSDVTATGPGSAAATIAQKNLPYLFCQGRLTTESGVPVSTADRTAQSTIYFTPYNGSQIALYTGSLWVMHTFTERSLALSSLTSGKNYDVFLYNNAGTLTLELSSAWTNDTTRADALTTQDGILVKNGATTRRYLGTFRSTSTSATEDSNAKRFLWNQYNQVYKPLIRIDTTASWTYTTATWRQANGSASNQVEYVSGSAATFIDLTVYANCFNSSGSGVSRGTAVGVDGTSPTTGTLVGANGAPNSVRTENVARYIGYPGLGYHYLTWLEASTATSTTTWSGEGALITATTIDMSGMFGKVLA